MPAVLMVDDHPANLLALEAVLAPLEVRIRRAVALDLRGDDVVVVIRDLGHDGTRPPDPDRGRGIELMRALMDDARVDLGGPMGGTATLRRRLVRARPSAGSGEHRRP